MSFIDNTQGELNEQTKTDNIEKTGQAAESSIASGPTHVVRRAEGFRFGNLLGKGFSLLFSSAYFIPLAFVIMLPQLICSLYFPMIGPYLDFDWTNALINELVSTVCVGVLSAVLIYAVIKKLQGERTDFGKVLSRGVAASLRSIITTVIVAIIAIIGTILLIIPGWIWLSMLWVAVPVTVVERASPFSSLSRSSALTKGYRWTIFGIFVFFGVFDQIFMRAFGAILGSVMYSMEDALQVMWVGVYVLLALESALQAVMVSYGYYLLVQAKEGTNIDKIAAVFE